MIVKRNLVHLLLLSVSMLVSVSCLSPHREVITVDGPIRSVTLGKTLPHEHLLVDFIGADSTGYHRWNKKQVTEKVLPYLSELKNLGFEAIVECTPAYLGRDPELLRMLSEASGLKIITNTGYYSAVGGKFLPPHAHEETAVQLAQRWIDEAESGIEGTGIYPGFIKISVEPESLKEINRKIVEAACITHKSTGLVIMSHTGPAKPAFEQLQILEEYDIHPSAFIWTHAQNEQDFNKHVQAAKAGAWVAFDGFRPDQLERYVDFVLRMKKEGLLERVLLSHDAGWYDPAKPDGGEFRGFTDIQEVLIPALEKNGLAQQDIYNLFTANPALAFQVKKRLME